MKSRLVLIKVGGGFITDKSQPYTTQPDHIEEFAKQFAGIWQKNHESTDFILGTGTGSFGHTPAHQYGLRDGAHSPEQFYGMAVTHNSVTYLNNIVANALTAQQVPAFSVSPGTLMTYRNGRLDTLYLDSLDLLLRSGCVPILHGDGAPDSTRGVTIISTEQALQACLEAWHDRYQHINVIYVMDTDGVLDAKGHTIPELGRDQSITVLGQHGHDVTGSITSKIANARLAAETASAVYLICGSQPDSLAQALAGKAVGTRIL